MTALLAVDDALLRLLAVAVPLDAETVPLAEAGGRVLAEDLIARRTQPPFAASAMDGYAVAHADLVPDATMLRVSGEAAAGHPFAGTVEAGACVRIFTGAPLPPGTDTVIIQENAERHDDGSLTLTGRPQRGAHVRPAGLDFHAGKTLLPAGRRLDAGALSLAAAANHTRLCVHRQPVVGILATGDELLPPGTEPIGPGQIIASNSVGVAEIVRRHGARTVDLGIAGDNRADLEAALQTAREERCDVLVALGGASVGDHDLVRPVFEQAGMMLDFWQIAMRPGKPLMAGRLGAMHVIGLPGNPVSSLICAHVFVAPLVDALQATSTPALTLQVPLARAIGANGNRTHYMRAITTRQAGEMQVDVFDDQDSSIISHFANADCLVIRPPEDPPRAAGDPVTVRMLASM